MGLFFFLSLSILQKNFFFSSSVLASFLSLACLIKSFKVAFLDDAVAAGEVTSRAALVASALEREMRRRLAERDARILRESGTADDLGAVVEWTVENHALDG